MIVDDDSDILQILEIGLQKNGFNTIAFSDPVEALNHFKNNRDKIDFVITDARMPSMTGFELSRMIKQEREDVRVILISAFEINKPEFDIAMPSTHIDGFIAKPFHLTQLVEAVRTLDKMK